jgi:hypothetical protein
MKEIAAATRLRRLWLSSSEISDWGVAHLNQLPRLRYLELHSPRLTATSLRSLARIKTLRYVVLRTSNITPKDVAEFQAARPDINIHVASPP